MTDKIRIEIFDSNNNKIGKGPVYSAGSLRITRALDGAGNISINFPGTEERAKELIDNERIARCYSVDNENINRYVGGGVLRNINFSSNGNSWGLQSSGPDLFDTLKRFNLMLRREYREQTLKSVIEDVCFVAGWTAKVENSVANNLITIRFDGESVLKALQVLANNYGLHFRESENINEIEFGYFGNETDIVAILPKSLGKEFYKQTNVLLINKISVSRNTQNLVNWIVPLGGGEGLAALTLAKSTRTFPYTIENIIGPDGQLIYFIKDSESINKFGISQKPLLIKDITPIDNTDIGIERAANALYDASIAYLQRYSKKLVTYKLSINRPKVNIKPGSKIRIVYKGFIYNNQNQPVDFLDIDEFVWVLKTSESFTKTSTSLDLEVATVDRYEEDAAKIIIGNLEAIELRNLKIQPYPTTTSFVYGREIDNTHSAIIPVNITNGVLYLDRCQIRFKTRPFRATAKSAASIPAVTGTTESAESVVGTTSSGGAVAQSSGSGGALVATSDSGGGSVQSSANSGIHDHFLASVSGSSGAPTQWANYVFQGPFGNQSLIIGYSGASLPSSIDSWDVASPHSHDINIPAHSHGINIPNHTHTINIPNHTHELTIPAHSHGITIPGHTHDLAYGIVDDTQTPESVSVFINGTDRTIELGGPWAINGNEIDETIEISKFINGATGGLRQEHSVEFRCLDGQGEIELTVELKTTVQSLQQV